MSDTVSCFYFHFFSISNEVRLSTQSKQAPIQKLLHLNERPKRLIDLLWSKLYYQFVKGQCSHSQYSQLIRTSNQSTILAKIIWQFAVFPVKSDLPQVQRFLVSSIIKVLYELPDKLLKNLKSSEIRKYC